MDDPLPRQPGYEICFDPLTDDYCGASQPEIVEADPFRHSSPDLRARSAGLSATPTTTAAEPTPSSDDDIARPTVVITELHAVFKADGPKLEILAEVKRFVVRLAFKIMEAGFPFKERGPAMSVGYDQEGKTQIMTNKQAMEKSTAPRPSTKGGKNVGPKIGGQGGFVRIGALTKIATAAAAIAAVTIYKGCKSGNCTRSVADAALITVGAPVTWTNVTELSRTPEGRAELQEAVWGQVLDERSPGLTADLRWW